MAQRALKSILKIVVFVIVMLVVAKVVPYEGFVNNLLYRHISLSDAQSLTEWFLREPYPEPYDALNDYIKLFVNVLISVPLFSFLVTAISCIRKNKGAVEHVKECYRSIVRRITKLIFLSFVFCLFFRSLPYEIFFSDGRLTSSLTIVLIICINLLITIVCYWFIAKNIMNKRSL